MAGPSLSFLGAVGTVTGSKFLVSTGESSVLLDCGLFQGLSSLRRRNWAPPPEALLDVAAIVLTHAHLDHTGYLPLLVRQGWRGPVYCTTGTARLTEVVLADSAHLMEEEARQAAEAGWSKHARPLPLYDRADARRATELLHEVPFGTPVPVEGGIRLRFGRAGHILGSAWAELQLPGRTGSHTLLSSGDLGRPDHPLLVAPDPRPVVDTLLLESTYGNRLHEKRDELDRLATAIEQTTRRGGSVLIPAFAVDRTEVLIYELIRMRRAGTIPQVPIVVDSPMALTCLNVYRDAYTNGWGEYRPDAATAEVFDTHGIIEARTADESERWNDPDTPAVIVSASGMASGGRVLHHLRHMLPNRRHTVAIVGFAAVGTRARELAEGAAQIKIHGRYVPVRAEILALHSLSAHADKDDLFAWATAAQPPDTCYVIHGEPDAAHALAARLRRDADWTAIVPRPDERVLL